jgi:hypothetical protein
LLIDISGSKDNLSEISTAKKVQYSTELWQYINELRPYGVEEQYFLKM